MVVGICDANLVEMGMFDDYFVVGAAVDGEDSSFRSNKVTAPSTFSTTPISPGVFLELFALLIT